MSAVVALHVRPLVRAIALGVLLGVVGGCGKPPMWRANIQSDDPDERVMAIRAVAEAHDQASVPHLVDRLEDEDAAVRFFAIVALRKITGQRFGYDYAQSAADRARSVALWRRYMRSDRRAVVGKDEQAPTVNGKEASEKSGH